MQAERFARLEYFKSVEGTYPQIRSRSFFLYGWFCMNNLNATPGSYTILNCPACLGARNKVYSNLNVASGFAFMTVSYAMTRLFMDRDCGYSGDLSTIASGFLGGYLIGKSVKNVTETLIIPVIDRKCEIHIPEQSQTIDSRYSSDSDVDDPEPERPNTHRVFSNTFENPTFQESSDEENTPLINRFNIPIPRRSE